MIKLSQLIEDTTIQKNRIAAAQDRINIARKAVDRTTTPTQRKKAQFRVQKAEDRLRKIKLNISTKPEIHKSTINAARKQKATQS